MPKSEALISKSETNPNNQIQIKKAYQDNRLPPHPSPLPLIGGEEKGEGVAYSVDSGGFMISIRVKKIIFKTKEA